MEQSTMSASHPTGWRTGGARASCPNVGRAPGILRYFVVFSVPPGDCREST
jgi:hypothetical protein